MRLSLLVGCLVMTTQVFSQTIEQDLKEFSEGTVFRTNIHEIESLNIQRSILPDNVKPWSSSFWPNRAGGIGVRYKNSDLREGSRIVLGTGNAQRVFENNLNELQQKLYDLSEEELGELSPAEKYDLLVGDTNFTFSKQLFLKINENKEHWGATTFWTGICHGWAPASIHLPRPSKMLRLPILGGTRTLAVYPEDIKAMGSFLWANMANPASQMDSGNRCNQKYPKIDRNTGEVLSLVNFSRQKDECRDTDPLVMHLVTVNRIALMKRSFVVEVDFNAPVNNHPLSGYEIKFFNLNDFKKDGSLAETIVPLSSLKKDILTNSRHPRATHVVGVEMKLLLAHWQNPKRMDTNSASDDTTLEDTIIYQLDLDAKGEPLKGHWRSARNPNSIGKINFPDFIWNDYQGFRPAEYYTYLSFGLEADLALGLNNQFLPAAQRNSAARIKLSNETRLSHRVSKAEGLQDQAKEIMTSQNVLRSEAANQLESILNGLGIPQDEANPMLLSKVVLKLFDLAK